MVLSSLCSTVTAADNAALVIVNQDYRHLAVLETGATAELVSDALSQAGFAVETLHTASNGEMLAALRRLRARSVSANAVVFYFVGYARQLRGKNFLLPGNVELRSAFDLLSQGVDLQSVIDAMKAGGSRFQLAVVDGAYAEPSIDHLEGLGPALAAATVSGTSVVILGGPTGQTLKSGAWPEEFARAFANTFKQPDRPIGVLISDFVASAGGSANHRGELAVFRGDQVPDQLRLSDRVPETLPASLVVNNTASPDRVGWKPLLKPFGKRRTPQSQMCRRRWKKNPGPRKTSKRP